MSTAKITFKTDLKGRPVLPPLAELMRKPQAEREAIMRAFSAAEAARLAEGK